MPCPRTQRLFFGSSGQLGGAVYVVGSIFPPLGRIRGVSCTLFASVGLFHGPGGPVRFPKSHFPPGFSLFPQRIWIFPCWGCRKSCRVHFWSRVGILAGTCTFFPPPAPHHGAGGSVRFSKCDFQIFPRKCQSRRVWGAGFSFKAIYRAQLEFVGLIKQIPDGAHISIGPGDQ
jgi:hypothetical protein